VWGSFFVNDPVRSSRAEPLLVDLTLRTGWVKVTAERVVVRNMLTRQTEEVEVAHPEAFERVEELLNEVRSAWRGVMGYD
jgi:hypothetical protein